MDNGAMKIARMTAPVIARSAHDYRQPDSRQWLSRKLRGCPYNEVRRRSPDRRFIHGIKLLHVWGRLGRRTE